MSSAPYILHIAVCKPMRRCYDYLLPEGSQINPQALQPGIRVQVPFGPQQMVGMLLAVDQQSDLPVSKLRPITAILDEQPLITPALFTLYEWASRYYQHPIGEVMLGSLPTLLRRVPKQDASGQGYQLTPAGLTLDPNTLKRSPKQLALWQLCKEQPAGINVTQIKTAGFTTDLLRALVKKELLSAVSTPPKPVFAKPLPKVTRQPQSPLALNSFQQQAVEQAVAATGFQTFLLQGVTGSGKTEVYLQVIAACLQRGKQALVLVPEIGLTPQTIARFEQRFAVPMVVLHSALSDRERKDAWLQAKQGEVRIVIGTRSAIFVPLNQLGVIVMDEEHDASFKQQSGFRYSARDLAIMRGRLENILVLLGTATPSLETLYNVQQQRFQLLSLPERAGNAIVPSFHLIDLRSQYLEHGLAPQLLTIMQEHLAQNNQVLLFLNRRGYAPALLCHECGWSAQCLRCDAKLTLHHRPARMICHHCASQYGVAKQCIKCQSADLVQVGVGTERLEEGLLKHFPDVEIIRIDRDTVRHKNAMEAALQKVYNGQRQILLGTQMLAKGHHFPNVTLVGIVDTDGGLFSTDFRATERMGQLILQVAGRAGRAEKPGQVFLQTHQPDHPLLQALIHQGYPAFADCLLQERQAHRLPPFSYLTLMRAECGKQQLALDFLNAARDLADGLADKRIQLLGPIPAPMERKAGHYRALLLIQSAQRAGLQQWLNQFMLRVEKMAFKGKVRWSIDVDPQEMG